MAATDQQIRLQFEGYMKEAEFLRAEALVCIAHVRRLSLFATSIAGFAVPVLATLMELEDGKNPIVSMTDFTAALQEEYLIIQFVSLGVGLSCLAFLWVYVGTFIQIFDIAKYYRESLAPAINDVAGQPDQPVMNWEKWLARERRENATMSDKILYAEPVPIVLYVFVYTGFFLFMSLCFEAFVLPAILVTILVVVLTLAPSLHMLAVFKGSFKKRGAPKDGAAP